MARFILHKALKSFGKKEILNHVSLEVDTGDLLGIFGRNGSGKSTLLKMLFGSLKADSIHMEIDGWEVHPSEVIEKRLMAYLPQHPFLPSNTKVRDVIPIYHYSEEKQDKVFYDPGVAKITRKRINQLSHGERKYFEVVLLGSLDHPFLLLDEPFSMLEPLQTQAIKEYLHQLKETKGIIITDHYYRDVLDVTTKNLVLKDGSSHWIYSEEDLKKFEYLRT
ncbi:MAG: ATP-binding cassette domain-containing protein [Bacteroidota bacterium]